MDANDRSQWTPRFLLLAVVAAAGCSSTPTGPTTPTPTPAPTVQGCTAGAPQPMTSFTANPATITNGDTFTLSWTAPCGFVSLAQKDQGPFILNQPSTGSYALSPGLAGYPTGAGKTVYVATNGDTAQRFEATVTVNARAAPTASISGSTTCYPYPSCGATMTASGSNYTSLSWSGCCSGTAATATCDFTDLAAHTCTVTATGPGGSATASKTVTGVHVAPKVVYAGDGLSGGATCNMDVGVDFSVTDEESSIYECLPPAVQNTPPCTYKGMLCPIPGSTSSVKVTINTGTIPAGGLCYVTLQVRDRFGALSNAMMQGIGVSPCP